MAVQLAKYFGADVYSTCSGGEQMELIERLGATAIDYTTEEVGDYVAKYTDGAGFDLIFDSVGGANLTKSFAAARLNAQIATTVSLCELDLSPAHFKGLSIHVVFMLIPMLHDYKREDHGKILSRLSQIIEEGRLKPVVDERRFSLEEAGKAHAHLESGNAIGKVVIENRVN
ncbi:zinc-binding dehydrogenase [Lewinella sp. JB7]|nr:zinc-binding dehydrogenase [Lewinella sp. JB7]